jgi:hypothetical protein
MKSKKTNIPKELKNDKRRKNLKAAIWCLYSIAMILFVIAIVLYTKDYPNFKNYFGNAGVFLLIAIYAHLISNNE